jgi:hypothetical protein
MYNLSESEGIRQPQYCIRDMFNAGSPSYWDFFTSAMGDPNRDDVETNLYFAGALPKGKLFLTEGIRLVPFGQLRESALFFRGHLEFIVGSKTYYEMSPLHLFLERGERLNPPIVLAGNGEETELRFRVVVRFDSPFSFEPGTARLGCYLDGVLYRPTV